MKSKRKYHPTKRRAKKKARICAMNGCRSVRAPNTIHCSQHQPHLWAAFEPQEEQRNDDN
jgi:hypothetical protein